jgi:mannose-6-phosphate isomerase-like protein (cupin superfamily)
MTTQQPINLQSARALTTPPRGFLSFLAYIRGNGRDTGGLHLIELVVAPGDASPWHVHHDEDEWFYVIEGELDVIVGDSRSHLVPGSFAYGPRDIPHGFRSSGAMPARFLMITVGASFSDFIAEMSEPAAEAVLPGPVEIDVPKLVAAAKRYGMDILGPLPE